MTLCTDDPDQDLVYKAQNGDKRAATDLCWKYRDLVIGVLRQKCRLGPDEDPSEVFDRAMDWFTKDTSRYKGECKFKDWLIDKAKIRLRVMRRRKKAEKRWAIEHSRRLGVEAIAKWQDGTAEIGGKPDSGMADVARTQKAELREIDKHLVHKAVAELPPAERAVIDLKYFTYPKPTAAQILEEVPDLKSVDQVDRVHKKAKEDLAPHVEGLFGIRPPRAGETIRKRRRKVRLAPAAQTTTSREQQASETVEKGAT